MSTHLVKVSFYQPWTMAQGHRHCRSRGQVTAPRGNSTPWLRRRGPAKEALPKWSVLTASSSAQGRRVSSLEEQPCAVLVSISRGHLRGFWPACTRQGERQVQESCSPPSTSPGPGLVFSKHRFGVLSLPSQNFSQLYFYHHTINYLLKVCFVTPFWQYHMGSHKFLVLSRHNSRTTKYTHFNMQSHEFS